MNIVSSNRMRYCFNNLNKITMNTLKVKFKLNGLEFELEGNEDTVKGELSVFKDFVVNNLMNKISLTDSKLITVNDTEEIIDVSEGYIPQLKEFVMRDIPKSETQWIIIYSYFASKFGQEPFVETDIKKMYEESKRKNESRMKNFSTNFTKVVSGGFIRVLNSEEYILIQKGIDEVKVILGQSSEKGSSRVEGKLDKVSVKKVKPKASQKSASFSLVSDLNLNPSNTKSLKMFYGEFLAKSFFEKNLLFVYYMERIIKINDISANHIYTCYKHVGQKIPGNLYQSLVDTKNHKGWIETKDINDLKITIAGENYVEHDFHKA
jgi:hypothetical protein